MHKGIHSGIRQNAQSGVMIQVCASWPLVLMAACAAQQSTECAQLPCPRPEGCRADPLQRWTSDSSERLGVMYICISALHTLQLVEQLPRLLSESVGVVLNGLG